MQGRRTTIHNAIKTIKRANHNCHLDVDQRAGIIMQNNDAAYSNLATIAGR